VFNNIIYAGSNPAFWIWRYMPKDSIGSQTTSDYNLYYSTIATPFAEYNAFYTFFAWQNYSKMDFHSIFARPQFADSVGGDYSLQASSPGWHKCADGSDMGADMSTIPIGGVSDTISPTVPQGKKKGCGCGSGTILAFLPPIYFKIRSKFRKKNRA
jgi:hypothetical protein